MSTDMDHEIVAVRREVETMSEDLCRLLANIIAPGDCPACYSVEGVAQRLAERLHAAASAPGMTWLGPPGYCRHSATSTPLLHHPSPAVLEAERALDPGKHNPARALPRLVRGAADVVGGAAR